MSVDETTNTTATATATNATTNPSSPALVDETHTVNALIASRRKYQDVLQLQRININESLLLNQMMTNIQVAQEQLVILLSSYSSSSATLSSIDHSSNSNQTTNHNINHNHVANDDDVSSTYPYRFLP